MIFLRRISFVGYGITALAGLAMGIVYSFAPKIMPYHLEAMGASWDKLNAGSQVMLLNYQRSVGAGFLTTSVALLSFLIFPFRRRELWGYVAAFMTALLEWGNITIRTASVHNNTPADPPLMVLISFLGVIFASFLASLVSYKREA